MRIKGYEPEVPFDDIASDLLDRGFWPVTCI